MRIFKRWQRKRWRKKLRKHKEEVRAGIKEPSLERICGQDRELYRALSDTMRSRPWEIKTTIDEAAQKAKEAENSGDSSRAVYWYRLAGGLALWKGDTKGVEEFFGKCQELLGREFPIVKIAERAVKGAQEFYKFLETKEEEK